MLPNYNRKSKIHTKIKSRKQKKERFTETVPKYFFEERLFEESIMKITNRVCRVGHYDGIDSIFWQAGVFPSSLNNRHFCNNDSLSGRDEPVDAPVVDIPGA